MIIAMKCWEQYTCTQRLIRKQAQEKKQVSLSVSYHIFIMVILLGIGKVMSLRFLIITGVHYNVIQIIFICNNNAYIYVMFAWLQIPNIHIAQLVLWGGYKPNLDTCINFIHLFFIFSVVSITSPLPNTYLSDGSVVLLRQIEKRKYVCNDPVCSKLGQMCVPIVAETLGH